MPVNTTPRATESSGQKDRRRQWLFSEVHSWIATLQSQSQQLLLAAKDLDDLLAVGPAQP